MTSPPPCFTRSVRPAGLDIICCSSVQNHEVRTILKHLHNRLQVDLQQRLHVSGAWLMSFPLGIKHIALPEPQSRRTRCKCVNVFICEAVFM